MHKIRAALAALALVSIAACSSSITAPDRPALANGGTMGSGHLVSPTNSPNFNGGTMGSGH